MTSGSTDAGSASPAAQHEASRFGEVWLIRHGETEWSRTGRHTGRTDIDLTPDGLAQARDLRGALSQVHFDRVLVSPLLRARRTAVATGIITADDLARADLLDPDLLEWNYGSWEGRTTAEIRRELDQPDWTIWSAPIPGGEQPDDVQVRAQAVLHRIDPVVRSGGRVALVAHGHFLRILTAAWLALPAHAGRLWALSPATTSVLGFEHEQRVILRWNCQPTLESDSG